MPELITSQNIDKYLNALAKRLRKIIKAPPLEIVLVGGSAIMTQYTFRPTSEDIDALISDYKNLKEAALYVADEYDLPNNWINQNFIYTESYSPELRVISKHYKKFYNILEVRVVPAVYLIAMKLRSGREYKRDISDIFGILSEEKKKDNNITADMISAAIVRLYGSLDPLPEISKQILSGLDTVNMDLEKIDIIHKKQLENESIVKSELSDRILENEAELDEIIRQIKNCRK